MAAEGPSERSRKRKEPPETSKNGQQQGDRGRAPKRVKMQNARTILTQTSDAALSNGELNLQAFLKAREFEIKALEDGMRRSKAALTTRAFQQVPRDMRRRTASHNVKRVPRRLQKRAAREMREDNTPTVMANKRKPGSSRGRLRAEIAKKLGLLAQKKKTARTKAANQSGAETTTDGAGLIGRTPRPKSKKGLLNEPPKPPSKFRKRQMHKTWLPTHIYHAKRAKMTEPKNPLWRLAIPLTPTQKCYRPTHQAAGARGTLCWDMSYMSTISLEGTATSLEKVLRAVGLTQDDAWGQTGTRWRQGKRTWSGWLSSEQNGTRKQIGPATVIWCHAAQPRPESVATEDAEITKKPKRVPLRQMFIRTHPAAFLELWNVLLGVSKMQRPLVRMEDLRFEIGSIEMTGPNSIECLLGILHPLDQPVENGGSGHVETFKALAGVTNAASLTPNALLTFSVMDPRLRYPPRKAGIFRSGDEEAAFSLLETLARWPADQSSPSPNLFDRHRRFNATRMPSQKSINRRKGAAPPGEYPSGAPADQPIPVLLFSSRVNSSAGQGTWTLLAPWKCILPMWYCLMHHPLSMGGNPRFGGLQELQQTCFENGRPWFPGDYPGTQAGWAWELERRRRRKEEWEKRPKGRRIEFATLDLGTGKKGEIGFGWACDFGELGKDMRSATEGAKIFCHEDENTASGPATPPPFEHLPSSTFASLLSNSKLEVPPASLATVRITLFSRGVPLPCARIYRLPSAHRPSPSPAEPSHQTKPAPAVTSTNPPSNPPPPISSLPMAIPRPLPATSPIEIQTQHQANQHVPPQKLQAHHHHLEPLYPPPRPRPPPAPRTIPPARATALLPN